MIEYNVYCDESCHLQNDDSDIMVMGALWCLKDKTREISNRIREIKQKHGLAPDFEIKWNKVSPSKLDFYLNLVDYFFDDDDLHFRCIVVPNKKGLDHKRFNQTHDDFYYRMYFDLLKIIFVPGQSYYVYIDIKDTKSQNKVDKLCDVLRNNHYDYQKKLIRRVQQIRSEEVEQLPLVDLLIGSVGYLHRGLKTSEAKLKLISRIQQRSGYSLMQTTLYREDKTNIFIWQPQK